MTDIYVFNGDADGLCALQQLRLAEQTPAALVTGVKRDIRLLERVSAHAGDRITALDISLDSNRQGLTRLLELGASVRYFDHHYPGAIPAHPNLHAHIDTAADVCTSILVDRHLSGRHRLWAIVAAFGDSLPKIGRTMATASGLDAQTTEKLEQLGISLNYNAYGETLSDLHFDPAILAEYMMPFANPLDFMASSDTFIHLREGYAADMEQARRLSPAREVPGAVVVILPEAPWARRAIGVLANEMMQARPDSAIAILSPNPLGHYAVSVRVPSQGPVGADEFCRKFETGGGRKLAGGINHLPPAEVERFIAQFEGHFASR